MVLVCTLPEQRGRSNFTGHRLFITLLPQTVPTIDPQDRKAEEDTKFERDKFYSLYRIEADACQIDEYPQHPRLEYSPRKQYRGQDTHDGDKSVHIRIRGGVIEYLGQEQMYLAYQEADQQRDRRNEHPEPQPVHIAQCPDGALLIRRFVFPRKPPVYTHPAEIKLQEHIGIKMDLVKNDEKEYCIQNSGRPGEDIRPCRQKNGDQAQHRPDKLNIADPVFKNCKKSLFYIK